ncbi:MAG: HAD-IA family hydrolase [Proteobacteria bacterium]|nr:HAD-IA family hydrolase [Pseudomonadota bacterium]
MASLRALLFDVDGTIADTEELHRLCYNQAFVRSGVDWQWDRALYTELLMVSGGIDRLHAYVDRLAPDPAERDRLRVLIPFIHRTKSQEYARRLEEGQVQIRPGVIALMEEATAAGVAIGCVSSSNWDNVGTLLGKVFRSAEAIRIDSRVGGEMVPRRKPAPDVYELLVRMMRVPADACVAVEDSPNGVASARAAGVRVLATPSQWTAGQDFSSANRVLPSLEGVRLADLQDLVKG